MSSLEIKAPEQPSQNEVVDKTTEFLMQFGKKGKLVEECLNEDSQLKLWFEEILKSEESKDNINQILTSLEQDLNEEDLKEEIKSIIAEIIPWWYKIEEKQLNNAVNNMDEKQKQEKENENKDKILNEEKKIVKEKNIKYKKEIIELKNLRQELLKDHPDIDNKAREKAELIKQKIPEQSKKQLEERGYDENFVNDYILLKVTLNEIKWNPDFKDKITEFEDKVNWISNLDAFLKNIDNYCNIPDTNLQSFSSENITQTRHELFYSGIWNEDLIDLKESNIKNRELKDENGKTKYDEMFPEMTEESMVQTFWKFLKEWAKKYLDEYNKHLDDGTITEYRKTDECKQFLNTIENIKTAVDNKTKDLIEELCIMSQIKWMYMCMWEWTDFNLNKANEIENNNGVLTLKGHIDWIDFSLRQDTKNPDGRLQTSTKLKKNEKSFLIWDNFKDSNFILPSQDEIFNVAVNSVKSDWALERATTPWEYVKLTQERFMKRIDKIYEDTKYIHHYMKQQVKWEKTIDKTIKTVEKIKGSKLNSTIDNVGPNQKLYDFLNMIDFNVKNSSDVERDKQNELMEYVQSIINATVDGNGISWQKYPAITEYYLKDKNIIENTRNMLNGKSIWEWESLFDFFSKYKNNSDTRSRDSSIIDLISLDLDLIPSENPELHSSIKAKIWEEEHENKNEDKNLQAKLDGLNQNDNNIQENYA